jgi:outer membrane receptor protein involved in Fe transport
LRHTGSIALALLLAAGGVAEAQRTGAPGAEAPRAAGEVRGTVVDAASGQPIRSASVEVRNAAGGLVTGALTGADGTFRIPGVRPGRYSLRVAALGHTTAARPGIVIAAESPVVEAGTVRLAASAVQIEGLTVTAERREASLAPDRNTYSLRDLPSAAGGNAVDALRNVPSVEVDIDGKVSLRGNENVVVQINGRPSPMRGEQLGAFLAQLPANMVDRVEVIPNPSAKFDPEGMAGIVNVVLKQNTDLGTSGGITAGGGTTGQVNVSGNLGYQKGALTLFGNYGFMRDDRETAGFVVRENRFQSPLTFVEQRATGRMSPLSHTLNTSAEYKLGARDMLSTSLLLTSRAGERRDFNVSRNFDASRSLVGMLDRTAREEATDLGLDYVLGYRHTVRPRQNEFAAELRYNREREDELLRINQQDLLTDGTTEDGLPFLENQATDERTRNWTLTADYTRPLGERLRLETGYRGTLRRLESDYDRSLFSHDANAFEADATRSNEFAYDEQVHAAYGVLGGSLGKFNLQGGLRVERALTEFDLATTGEAFENDYGSFFPSALAAYNLSDERQLKASYSKRVERPRSWQLNPFGRVEDALNVSRGNPFLKPEYTHSFEVGFQQSGQKGTVQVTPFFRHTTDAVRRYTTVDAGTGVATTTFVNAATTDSYGTDFNGSVRLGRLTGFGGVSAFQQVTDASNLGSDVGSDAFGWSARANATLRITPRLDAQGFLMYRAPMATEQGRISGRSMFNMALRQKLMGDRASVSLRVVDPFNQMRFRSLTDDEDLYQESERRMGARGVFLSFSYNFGQQPRVRREQQPERGGDDDEMP